MPLQRGQLMCCRFANRRRKRWRESSINQNAKCGDGARTILFHCIAPDDPRRTLILLRLHVDEVDDDEAARSRNRS